MKEKRKLIASGYRSLYRYTFNTWIIASISQEHIIICNRFIVKNN